jgi:hypothetical protein
MLRVLLFRYVHLSIASLKVFSMQINLMYVASIILFCFSDLCVLSLLHDTVLAPRHRQIVRFLVAYSPAAPPTFVIHHLLSTGVEIFSNDIDKAAKASSCKGAALQLLKFPMQKANVYVFSPPP